MSKLLEYIIHKVLLTEEPDSNTKPWNATGYEWKIFGTDTILGRRIDKIATSQLGAFQGVFIVGKAKDRPPKTDQDVNKNIQAIIEFIKAANQTLATFYSNGDFLYIFKKLKSNKRRIVFALIVEKKSKYTGLINAIKTVEASQEYYILDDSTINELNNVRYMSGADYSQWLSAFPRAIEKLEKRYEQQPNNALANQITSIKNKLDNTQILNIDAISKIDVPEVDTTEKVVEIDKGGFEGTAREITDVTGQKKYIPIEGIHNVIIRDTDIEGVFEGKFAENGMPESGFVEWDASQKGANLGGVKTFRGILYTIKDDYTFQHQTIEDPGFTFKYKEGVFEYWTGHKYRGAYKSFENQSPTGQGFLDHGTSIADRNTITNTYNISDTLDFISVIEKEIGSGYDIALPYVIGPKILFKGSFNPMPQNGSLLYKSDIDAWSDQSIIGTYRSGKFTISPDFKTILDEAKQEIDAIKIFQDESGDMEFNSYKTGGDSVTVSIPKSEIKDIILLSEIGDGLYEFSYMNTDLNKRYPTPGKYTYYLYNGNEMSDPESAGLTPEFIELQKALGNIK